MLEDCKKVMAALAVKAKATYEKINAATMTMVAAVFEADAVFEEDKSNNDSEEFIDPNEADEYVSSPFILPQYLLWTCCIDAPATCTGTPIQALIDHGSAPVLISSNLTDILCLTA